MKCVGKINGEPVYEVSSLPVTQRRVPVAAPLGSLIERDTDADHRVYCLPCLFNSLVEPTEEFEEFAANTAVQIFELDALLKVAHGETAVELAAERQERVNELALASQGIENLKALVALAAHWL